MSTTNEQWEIKPYSLSDLSVIYGMSTRTINRWMAKHKDCIGEREGRFYTALQVKIIFQKFGLPAKAED